MCLNPGTGNLMKLNYIEEKIAKWGHKNILKKHLQKSEKGLKYFIPFLLSYDHPRIWLNNSIFCCNFFLLAVIQTNKKYKRRFHFFYEI